MKKISNFLLLIAVLVLGAASFVSCENAVSGTSKKAIVGTWQKSLNQTGYDRWTFKSNGKYERTLDYGDGYGPSTEYGVYTYANMVITMSTNSGYTFSRVVTEVTSTSLTWIDSSDGEMETFIKK